MHPGRAAAAHRGFRPPVRRSLGADEGAEATERMLDRMVQVLGGERASRFHSHFSRIEFTPKGGEKRHRTFDDNGGFGPDPEPLMEALGPPRVEPHHHLRIGGDPGGGRPDHEVAL